MKVGCKLVGILQVFSYYIHRNNYFTVKYLMKINKLNVVYICLDISKAMIEYV